MTVDVTVFGRDRDQDAVAALMRKREQVKHFLDAHRRNLKPIGWVRCPEDERLLVAVYLIGDRRVLWYRDVRETESELREKRNHEASTYNRSEVLALHIREHGWSFTLIDEEPSKLLNAIRYLDRATCNGCRRTYEDVGMSALIDATQDPASWREVVKRYAAPQT